MSGRPAVIAHRAGNAPEGIAAAARHADVIEVDVHLFRGRLEVRHAKTIGPLDILWERWYLVPRTGPRILLEDVVAAMDGVPAALAVDLKGVDPRLPGRALRALEPLLAGGAEVFACSRNWWNARRLETLAGGRVPVLRSVGNRWQLRALLRLHPRRVPGGVSINARLLDPGAAAALRARTDRLWSWPANGAEDARRLVARGVTGLISDAPERLGDARSP